MKQKPEVVKAGNAAVKLYTLNRPGGVYFQVADYSTGRRVLRSFGAYADAKDEASRIARLLSTGQATAAAMGNNEAASYGRAVELLRDTGDSLEIAAARYAEAVKVLGTGERLIDAAKAFAAAKNLPDATVAEVLEEMLKAKAGREKRTVDDLRNRLTRFAEAFAVPIASVTTSDVQKWLDKLKTSERDKLNYRSKVNTLFRWALRRGYVFTNPAGMTEKPEAKGSAPEVYSPEEFRKLLAAAQAVCPEHLPCLLIGAFAGLRSSEIERLAWEDIDLKRGYITASGKKRGTPSRRLVQIQPNLAKWLADYAGRTGPVWTGKHDAFYDARQDIAKAAGVAWKENGLRDTFASCRLAVTQNAAQVSLEIGHRNPNTLHGHYKELITPKQGKAWFAISPAKPANVVSLGKAVVNE